MNDPADKSALPRLRLKADGRIIPLAPDGSELQQAAPVADMRASQVRSLRARSRLTQMQFASRIGVPIDTIRNWEQGKREPRGPARALLTLIDRAPDFAFAVLRDEKVR